MDHNMELAIVAQILSNQAMIIELNKLIMTAICGEENDVYKKYYAQLDNVSKWISDMVTMLLNMTDRNSWELMSCFCKHDGDVK